MDASAVGDFLDGICHVPGERLRLEGAWAKDEKWHGPADGYATDVEWIKVHKTGKFVDQWVVESSAA